MPRIAKADVNAALAVAAKIIKDAGGPDGRVSRADVKATLSQLPEEQRGLVDIFFKFIDHRDAGKGAQVTASDVDKAVTYAKSAMIAKYDLNNNGLSKDEIAKMSLTGKLAVELARTLRAAPVDDGPLVPPRIDEGFSEADEILAAGQVPRDWVPAVNLNAGTIVHAGGTFVGLDTAIPMSAEHREVATAALAVMWDRALQHRVDSDATVLQLGPRGDGTLKVGSFTRSDDGKSYLVADWRDVDDASFTLYFERLNTGKLRLAIEQFNN